MVLNVKKVISVLFIVVVGVSLGGQKTALASTVGFYGPLPDDNKHRTARTSLSDAIWIYRRLVGVPANPNASLLKKMSRMLDAGDSLGAAKLAMTDPLFYAVGLRNFASKYSNKDELASTDFDDLQALIIGVVRDELDARELLIGEYAYEGRDMTPAASRKDNEHYRVFDEQGKDPWRDLRRRNKGWSDFDVNSGVLTTRQWGKAFYDMGTNRRAVQYTMQLFMCVKMDQWKDRALPDDFVRRDVDRKPGGNAADFQNRCRSCHSGMDAMSPAFARMDFVGNEIVQLPPNTIAAKYNINAGTFPLGYVPEDETWMNYSTKNHNEALGFTGATQGFGLKSYAEMIANSHGFSECLSKRVFSEVCNRAPATADEMTTVRDLAGLLEADKYNIKNLFASIVTSETCRK